MGEHEHRRVIGHRASTRVVDAGGCRSLVMTVDDPGRVYLAQVYADEGTRGLLQTIAEHEDKPIARNVKRALVEHASRAPD